jgi:hypothetical protein
VRYIVGHGSRLSPIEYLVKDTGFKTPCWIWQRSVRQNGYAQMSVDRKPTYAHKVFYEKRFGRVPKGKQLDHLCRIRKCVNPDHLEPVTNQINTQRGGRTELNIGIVREMRKLRATTGISFMKISRKFEIPVTTTFNACTGSTWNNAK